MIEDSNECTHLYGRGRARRRVHLRRTRRLTPLAPETTLKINPEVLYEPGCFSSVVRDYTLLPFHPLPCALVGLCPARAWRFSSLTKEVVS